MSIKRPKFVDSPYFYVDENGWHLKEGAPEEVVEEFDEYMEYEKELEERGIEL